MHAIFDWGQQHAKGGASQAESSDDFMVIGLGVIGAHNY